MESRTFEEGRTASPVATAEQLRWFELTKRIPSFETGLVAESIP